MRTPKGVLFFVLFRAALIARQRKPGVDGWVIFGEPVEAAEAADAAFAGGEHGTGFFDAELAGFGFFGGSDPEDPVAAGDGSCVRPGAEGRLRGGEGVLEFKWQADLG